MARWLLEERRIPYREEAPAPIFHALISKRLGGDFQLPLVVTPEGPWAGITQFLEGLDERSRPGEKVFGESGPERARTREFVALFDEKLFWPAIQLYYHFMLDRRDTVLEHALHRVPRWQRQLVRRLFPVWQRRMRAGIQLDAFSAEAALAGIDEAFARVEAETRGSSYLGGDAPSTADIVFASLAAPLILPKEFAAPVPGLDELPNDYREIVERFRSRPAGQLVSKLYRDARPPPQAAPSRSARRFSLAQLILRPGLVLWAARLAVRLRPCVAFGNTVLVLSWRHVTDVLQRDADFLIAPVNEKRIEDVSGPFILGMDRSPALFAQREAVYCALRAADMAPVRDTLISQSAALLSAAKARHGRIDAVNGYSRLVAARTAASLFGIRGPTEQDLMRVLRAVFHETFLNLGNDPAIRSRGIAAGEELAGWIDDEISRRNGQREPGSDVLAGLLRAQSRLPLEPESVRWMLAGLIVGAVDTTATAVANASVVLLGNREMLAGARRDIDDPKRMLGWCFEALRFRPHNPIVLRRAAHATRIGSKMIPEGASVSAVTLSAMQDPAAFPRPADAEPTRPLGRYLHFGFGLHTCAGRDFNWLQIPHLVAELLRAGADRVATERTQGPFPDEVVVRLEGH